jgi:hypothetical protein
MMLEGCGEVRRPDVYGALCRWEHPFLLSLIRLRESGALTHADYYREADALCMAVFRRTGGDAAAFIGTAPA